MSISSSSSICPTKKLRKRELKKVEDDQSREVTFSKRRKGLFGKASELSLLCGAEIAFVAYSPHGNPFVFSTTGSPDEILGQLQDRQFWWEDPIDDRLDETDLEKYIGRMEALQEKVLHRLESTPISTVETEEPAFECCNGSAAGGSFDLTDSNFEGMTPPTVDTDSHPDPEIPMPECSSSAPDMQVEIWEELGMEEIAYMWEELGMGDFTSAFAPQVSDSPALEWTDADVDDMFGSAEVGTHQPEVTTSGWPDEEIDAMLRDWGIEAPSMDFLHDNGMRHCSAF